LLGMVLMSGGYRTQRLLVFMNPDLDPQGTGYHLRQAKLAIGSGGWFGRGLGKSYQKFAYLPEVSADSIFAIVAEELGFFVAAGLVMLLAFIILRALRVARDAPDPFGRFLAVGIATWLGFQSFLNIAVMVGLAPLTGLPLPFISAGGSALAANLAAAGLLLNISRHVPHGGEKRVQ
ncbi:MAG: FtsW/RodA/SpoVE family cell cycle protein, partial [bacterium]|nr:FtsW/RodA/SpoVE family cell cycle protein [bacterium]